MRKTPFFLLLGLIFCGLASYSQSLRQPISAIYTSLGAYSKKHVDVFSFTSNQAALMQLTQPAVGVYGERRFMLQETSMYNAVGAFKTKAGNFGLNLKYAGFSNFNENQIGLAYARSVGTKVDIGVQFNYYGYQIPSYVSDNALGAEIGAIVHISDKLNVGVQVANLIASKYNKTDEKLPAYYKLGLGYDASDKFYVSAELVKEEDFPVNLNAGIQYNFVKQFFARVGVASATSTAYAGLGLAWNNLRLDVTGSYHPQLGLSPGLMLIMNFGKK